MSAGDQVRGQLSVPIAALSYLAANEGCCVTYVVTRMFALKFSQCLPRYDYDILQIICLFDVDIVFQPNGNFDEIYIYVRTASSSIHKPD
jgi:hypothetical protein